MKRPDWYSNDYDSGWERTKAAFRNDWEQTKHDFGSSSAPDLGQDVDDTAKQMAGTEDPFARREAAFRFGYAAQRQFKSKYPTWNNDLDGRLEKDYGSDYARDRSDIRYAYEYRYATPAAGERDQQSNRL